ncbi:MAG: hypothetical protein UU47_C0001G0041 [candidate division TM6 bacterium GW2011_GWE2_41_16]|nr:MAG: hypothetical protein UU47_C0001G0041 [candidate division TM6 bacterium GW2011_GWE2_41_16]
MKTHIFIFLLSCVIFSSTLHSMQEQKAPIFASVLPLTALHAGTAAHHLEQPWRTFSNH